MAEPRVTAPPPSRSFIGRLLENVVMLKASSLFSLIALLFSGYSLWETSLKHSELKVFVAPLVQYASPYQNSNFEVFAIPVTITNEGARSGTIMSMALDVSDGKRFKRFFSADLGQWTLQKLQSGDVRPFVPIPLPGRTSYTDVIQFQARTDETVMQIVEAAGTFKFNLSLDAVLSEDFGPIDRYWRKDPQPLSFEMILPDLDQRAFSNGSGTVAMHQKDWQSTVQPE
jgi:hypothetical protein